MAADDPDLSAIAAANYALASFEVGDTVGAVRSARQLLRRCGMPVIVLIHDSFPCQVTLAHRHAHCRPAVDWVISTLVLLDMRTTPMRMCSARPS